MEGSMATVGGFCVGSHFIAEHQRLSGLGYIFSASLPPMLTQAAISALDRFERDPQIFEQLQAKSKTLHQKFLRFSKLTLRGDEVSPVKHLYLAQPAENFDKELKLLTELADKVGILFPHAIIKTIHFYSLFPVHCSWSGCGTGCLPAEQGTPTSPSQHSHCCQPFAGEFGNRQCV